jgi:methyl-accepting chemotaxis protein
VNRSSLTLKKLFAISLAITLVMSAALVAALLQISAAQDRVSAANQSRYDSYLLADELRQSSDDLTRLARTYVVTGDPAFEKQYQQIIDIRNGKAPRPQHYERIYWDFVAAGEAKPSPDGESVALQDLMKRAGFTGQELAKLEEAQRNSDELVKAETVAMNAVKGLYDDGTGHFTKKGAPDLEMARKLVHDASYHRNKA